VQHEIHRVLADRLVGTDSGQRGGADGGLDLRWSTGLRSMQRAARTTRSDTGSGYCIINDFAIAETLLALEDNVQRVLSDVRRSACG
jgi:hypothetical protein